MVRGRKTETMNRDEALRKVASLLKLANSNNANEAALAAQRAQEIMAKFQLDSAMLDVDAGAKAEPDEPILDFGKKGAPLDDTGGKKSTWRIRLADHIARANGCRIYLSGARTQIVGRPSDADTIRYLFAYLTKEVDRLCDREGKGCGTTWRNNFRLGVVDTIAEKLQEARRVVHAQAREEVRNNPLALMRVNTAIEKIAAKSVGVDLWMKAHMNLRSGRASSSSYDGAARAAGQAAGREINVGGRSAGALGGRSKMLGA
ncbi:MAG: DUF2786 domain-containing protein [Proteobacteria bacterium]|nr:DUF2786 domain-containing protein [Pseudomonadota bacterium]